MCVVGGEGTGWHYKWKECGEDCGASILERGVVSGNMRKEVARRVWQTNLRGAWQE